MLIQPQTQIDKLLGELSNLPKGRVLSEFALARFLNQADKLISFDAAHAWHVKGVANYYANEVAEMIRCFDIAINLLPTDRTLLNNYAACLMNQGQLEELYELVKSHIDFYITDIDLMLKLSRLALDRFNKNFIDEINQLFDMYSGYPHINQIQQEFYLEIQKVASKLENLNISWNDALQVSNLAFQLMFNNKVRSNSLVRIKASDDEIVNIIPLYTDIETVFKLNDEIFDEIFSRGLIDVSNKFMCMFVVASHDAIAA
ncbi:hypothetical protein [Acinetobacter baumannii]|uniref:hypothetical protein n=1 Tax=Acinetobacter baumannii TaxID=470 RepID=UPI00112E8CAA|nr:hypothetical protein [Acinetobacter baumannii]TPU47341.1 hypothetical protein FJU84_07375 [Acinetobacter baumannii]